MRQIAIVTNGDKTQFLEFDTLDGTHRFRLEGHYKFVIANPAIRPYIVRGIGDLLPVEQAHWLLRRRLRKLHTEATTHGIAIRHFQAVAAGFVELPVRHILDAWTRFLEDTTDHAVANDPESGQPGPNEQGVVLQGPARITNRDGKTVVEQQPPLLLSSVALVHQDLQRIGIPPARASHFIRALVEVQKVGHTAHFVTPHIAKWLLPLAEDPKLYIFVAVYCVYLGIQLDQQLGDLWKGAVQTYGIWLVLVPILVIFLWLKLRGQKVAA